MLHCPRLKEIPALRAIRYWCVNGTDHFTRAGFRVYSNPEYLEEGNEQACAELCYQESNQYEV